MNVLRGLQLMELYNDWSNCIGLFPSFRFYIYAYQQQAAAEEPVKHHQRFCCC